MDLRTVAQAQGLLEIFGSGDYHGQFNCPVAPSQLASGNSCTIAIYFAPTATRLRGANILIFDNGTTASGTCSVSPNPGCPSGFGLSGFCGQFFQVSGTGP